MTIMKKPLKKITKTILIVIAVILLLVFGGLIVRIGLNNYTYGDLKTFNYGFGGGVAGVMENYSISQEGDKFILSINTREMKASGEIEKAEIDGLRNIMIVQNLFAQNGIENRDKGLCDGFGEILRAEFENGELYFCNYTGSTNRNFLLCNYLKIIARDFEQTG